MRTNVQILEGDALRVLRTLPDQSINCCVTSPPYWGLRSYSTAAQVWGGDPDCRHNWGADIRTPWASHVPGPNGGRKNGAHSRQQEKWTGPYCQQCGAWRGDLGLEPTPELFVAHIVEVFREVRRVLRDDGTLWLNLGDSYATGGGKVGDCPGGGKQGARYRGDHGADPKSAGIGPQTQPNRMPIAGLKPKDLVGIPWRVAFALQADGWYLRSDIIWHKPNPMPESVTDRPTKAHEYLFLLAKSAQYYYDADAVMEPAVSDHSSGNVARKVADGSDSRLNTHLGRSVPWRLDREGPNSRMHVSRDAKHPKEFAGKNRSADSQSAARRMLLNIKSAREQTGEHDACFGPTRNRRSVWNVATAPFKGAHFATFPPKLVEPCILAGCPKGGIVLDCFAGAGTTGLVSRQHGRRFIGIELNPEYAAMARARAAYPHVPAEVTRHRTGTQSYGMSAITALEATSK